MKKMNYFLLAHLLNLNLFAVGEKVDLIENRNHAQLSNKFDAIASMDILFDGNAICSDENYSFCDSSEDDFVDDASSQMVKVTFYDFDSVDEEKNEEKDEEKKANVNKSVRKKCDQQTQTSYITSSSTVSCNRDFFNCITQSRTMSDFDDSQQLGHFFAYGTIAMNIRYGIKNSVKMMKNLHETDEFVNIYLAQVVMYAKDNMSEEWKRWHGAIYADVVSFFEEISCFQDVFAKDRFEIERIFFVILNLLERE